jgi:hypothetical protein
MPPLLQAQETPLDGVAFRVGRLVEPGGPPALAAFGFPAVLLILPLRDSVSNPFAPQIISRRRV